MRIMIQDITKIETSIEEIMIEIAVTEMSLIEVKKTINYNMMSQF